MTLGPGPRPHPEEKVRSGQISRQVGQISRKVGQISAKVGWPRPSSNVILGVTVGGRVVW